MREKILNKKNRIYTAFTIPVVVYAILLVIRIINAAVQTANFANEYRECANISMTNTILSGVNPYSLSSLEQKLPVICYLYGPLMSIIAAAIAILFPFVSVVTIHYGISFLSIIISAILISKMVYEHTETILMPATAFVLTIFCHWRYGYIYGAPDSLGLFILIAVLYILSKEKEDSLIYRFKPELAAFFVVLSFFTKQYFLMVAATGAVYLFYISRKQFIRYAVSGIIISLITFAIISYTCPLYWTYAIYFLKGPGAGAAMGKTGISYNNMQISYLGGMFLMLFIAGAGAFIKLICKYIKKKNDRNRTFTVLFWIQMIISGIVLRYIGNNAGAFLSYYLQLFTPALVVVACVAMDEFISYEGDMPILTNSKMIKKIWPVITVFLCGFFLAYTVYKVEPRLVINKLNNSEMAEWNRSEEILNEHLDGEIYYMPPVAYHGFKNERYVYNDGQPFVISEKFVKAFNESPVAQKLFPYSDEIMKKHMDYREEVVEKVQNGEYSLLVFMEDMDIVFTREDMSEHYKKLDTLSLRTGNWAWDMEFWVLKE